VTDAQLIPVADNISLAVAATPASDKPAIVLSNSIGASLEMWDEFSVRLSDRFRIIRYDARGHGRSQITDVPITIATLGEDVVKILDALKIPSAVLCGLSLGGLTAQWLAINHPHRFRGVVLANTAASFPPATMWHDRAKAVRENGMQPLVPATLDRWFTKPFQEKNPGRMAEVATMISGTSAVGYARCCEVLASTNLLAGLPSIKLPVSIICGRHDASTTPARGEEMANAIPNSNVQILESAHISSIEAADEFANTVRQFADSI